MEQEVIKILVERMGHLETILFSSALGFLITTTIALFSAVYSLINKSNVKLKPSFLIIGANLIYVLLSGYYYFILTHFYATASTIIPLKDSIPNAINIDKLWTSFQLSIPFLGQEYKIYLALLNAPLFPFFFASISIIGIWFIVKEDFKSKMESKLSLIGSIVAQLAVFYLMIWYPFNEFIELIMQ